MIIVDSSAIIAVLLEESDWQFFINRLEAYEKIYMSAGNYAEAGQVMGSRFQAIGLTRLEKLLAQFNVEIISVTAAQAQATHIIYQQYGRGRHKAQLNFGDCFAYALAAHKKLPLLCKGDDFIHTDLPLLHPAQTV